MFKTAKLGKGDDTFADTVYFAEPGAERDNIDFGLQYFLSKLE